MQTQIQGKSLNSFQTPIHPNCSPNVPVYRDSVVAIDSLSRPVTGVLAFVL